MKPTILSLLIILAASTIGFSSKPHPQEKRTAEAIRIETEAPKIDGLLNDAAWEQATWQGGFVQHKPYDGKAPSQETEFKILYTENHIYVAIRAWDSSPDSIVSRLSRRDDGDGDAIGIEFDSYFDKRTAFSFIVFASGAKHDKLITGDGDSEDVSWDAIWDAKTQIDDKGWTAEIQIPLNQLRFNKNQQQTWGLQVGRFVYRKEELSLWQPTPRDAPGWVHQFGILNGLEDIKPKRQFEVAPYLVAKTERYQTQNGNPFASGKNSLITAGVDAKIGVTNDITLDLTVLPDFGQVEADPSEVNLTAFETFFSEKRPFFIEGKSLFDFNFSPGDGDQSMENLFYSRRIGRRPRHYPDSPNGQYVKMPENTRILGAGKVTGKNQNGLSFGIMEVVTAAEYATIGNYDQKQKEMAEPLTNYFVGSVKKEFNKGNSQLSGMLTSTNRNIETPELEFLHKDAYSGGINFSHQWNNKNYFLTAKTFFSRVNGTTEAILRTQKAPARYFQRPDASHLSVDTSLTSLTGTGGSLSIGKGGDGHWRYMGFVNWKSPELETNDIGFVRSVDDIFQVFWVGYRYWEPIWVFREINLNLNQWTGHNFHGERTYAGGNVNLNLQFKNYWYLGYGINYQAPGLSTAALRGGPAIRTYQGMNQWVFLSTDSRKKIRLSMNGSNSTGANWNSNSLSANLTYKPSQSWVIMAGTSYSQSHREIQYVSNVDYQQDVRYINASLSQDVFSINLRVNFSITPDLSVQYYGRPFAARGVYDEFKKITNPRAAKPQDQYTLFTPSQISPNSDASAYLIDENMDGITDYQFSNPNFNFRDFQSNLVVRWEYKPGSTLFLVWSQNRDVFDNETQNTMWANTSDVFQTVPHNILLLKFSYRFF